MNRLKGFFLKSTAALDTTFFEASCIFIAEHNSKGALGFIFNQPYGRNLNDLEEFQHTLAFPIYTGGPVDQEHLYFIHSRPDLIADGQLITDNLYLGGNFQQAVEGINKRTLTTADLKIFIGYCGWNDGELEAEIEEGSWTLEKGTKEEVFMNW